MLRVGLLSALLLVLPGVAACGADERWQLDGHLVAGDTDVWLVDTTPVAIGGARITGERPEVGAKVHVEGRNTTGAVRSAERIVVGPVDASAMTSRLPAVMVNGQAEPLDPAQGRWRVAGRVVWVPAGTPGRPALAPGATVTVQGYTTPRGEVLAASITVQQSTPTATPSPTRAPAPAVAPTPTAPPPAQPAPPRKPEPPKREKHGDEGND